MASVPDIVKRRQAAAEETSLENLEDLLSQLTQEEIEEINGEFDSDNSLLPPSERCRNQTTKTSTGPFNKQHLLDFLEETAKNEKDWEGKVYLKETKGKVWKPKEQPEEKLKLGGEEDSYTEWDDILKEASEAELVDLAAVLGFHSFLNQVQYHASMNDEKPSETEGGFQGIAKSEILRVLPNEPPNPTDVDEALEQIESNSADLKTLNLNNIMNISTEKLVRFGRALKSNTNLKVLLMANTKMGDTAAAALAEGVAENNSVRVLNVESNYISGEKIVAILSAINKNGVIVELRVANQKPAVLGNKVEMEICRLVLQNSTLLRLGIFFQFADARFRVQEHLKKNLDKMRTERLGAKKQSS